MKYIFVYILFFTQFLFSQHKEKVDSTVYYSNLSQKNVQNNNYKDALLHTQKAIDYAKTNKNITAQAFQSFHLGKLFFTLKKYDDALASLLKSTDLYNNLDTQLALADAYYHIGMCYMAKQNLDLAAHYFEKVRTIHVNLKFTDKAALLTLQKGLIYKAKNNTTEAIAIFRLLIARPDTPEIATTKAEALYQAAAIESFQNHSNLALNYLNKALRLNEKSTNLEQRSSILLALSQAYEKILDKNSAYVYLKQHINLKERLSIINNERIGIDDYAKFLESERIKERIQINNQKQEQQKAKKFSKLISILAIALISILSLLSLSLYKNNIIRKQSNLLLEEKNTELEISKNKAEKASQARSEFLSTVSHELRTPLNAINGITHLLLQENPQESQIEYLSSLKFSGDYLTKFINEILEINKIESHKIEVERIAFNLKQLLTDIKNSLKELAVINNNTFNLEIDSRIPNYIIGDPTKLSQIILNLINNALKFTKNGNVTVSAQLEKRTTKDALIHFEVQDTGIGIATDKLTTVFDSFSQGSIEVNRKYGGTGLGLTIVKNLTSILGGQIQLESIVNQGSTFSFELGFSISEQIEPTELIPQLDFQSKLINKKILLVEDNKINQMITTKMLLNKQIICEVIDNGEDAIEMLRNSKFDLVLMDVHLPGINGTFATETIRTFDNITPIIALTAISLDENRDMLLAFGMNDVITKPFIPEEFYTVIAEHI